MILPGRDTEVRSVMLQIRRYEHNWSDDITPIGNDTFEKEPFPEWWNRHKHRFPHLEERIVEQWIFRHGKNSPFSFLDVLSMTWRLERWPTNRIITEVFSTDHMNADHDYRAFNQFGPNKTARPFEANGTWDYPIVVLETPNGITDYHLERPDVRFLLIEGHLRRRYLNAKATRGEALPEHEVFVLSLPPAAEAGKE